MTDKTYALGEPDYEYIESQKYNDNTNIVATFNNQPTINIQDWQNIPILTKTAIDTRLLANNWKSIN